MELSRPQFGERMLYQFLCRGRLQACYPCFRTTPHFRMPQCYAARLRPVLQIMMSRRGAAWLGLVPKIWTNAGNVLGVGLN